MGWHHMRQTVEAHSYRCGYCDREVTSEKGDFVPDFRRQVSCLVRVCPGCKRASFFQIGPKDHPFAQVPRPRYGDRVPNLPTDVEEAYEEARKCMSVVAHTSAALMCRKILQNAAVEKGADEGGTFAFYVDFLEQNGLVPPTCQDWVDEIRKIGNRATHSIAPVSQEDAELTLQFTSMLLRLIYDYPARLNSRSGS